MPLLRVLLAAVAALGLGAFTDASKKFAIEFPIGWSSPLVDQSDGTVQSEAPNTDGQQTWCRANSVQLASLKGLSQADLNAQFAAPLDQSTWAGFYSLDAEKIQLSEGAARIVDGKIAQTVTLTLAPGVAGAAKVKARFVSYILPGHTVNAGCFASAASYDKFKDLFEVVVASLKPL